MRLERSRSPNQRIVLSQREQGWRKRIPLFTPLALAHFPEAPRVVPPARRRAGQRRRALARPPAVLSKKPCERYSRTHEHAGLASSRCRCHCRTASGGFPRAFFFSRLFPQQLCPFLEGGLGTQAVFSEASFFTCKRCFYGGRHPHMQGPTGQAGGTHPGHPGRPLTSH